MPVQLVASDPDPADNPAPSVSPPPVPNPNSAPKTQPIPSKSKPKPKSRPLPTSPVPFITVDIPFTTLPDDIPFTTPVDLPSKTPKQQQNKPAITKPNRSSAFVTAALRKKRLADDDLVVTPGAGRRVRPKPTRQVPFTLTYFSPLPKSKQNKI